MRRVSICILSLRLIQIRSMEPLLISTCKRIAVEPIRLNSLLYDKV